MHANMSQANRLFISYAHADNELFDDAVKSFTEDLRGFYAAKTGNDLSVFFDRESIGWGHDWRSQIDGELVNAAIFMPIITMQYFNRPACREELNAFNQSAKRLNAQYLILPVVISGAANIAADHPIPEVAAIEALQYKNLEEAFLAGRGTSEWRRELSSLTDELISVISRAELSAPGITPTVPHSGEQSDPHDTDSDFLTSVEELETLTPVLTQEIEQVLSDLNAWTMVVTENASKVPPGVTAQQMRTLSLSMANQIKAPSEKLHDSGVKFADTTEKADAVMSSIKEQISKVPNREQRDALKKLVLPTQDSDNFHEVVSDMAALLDSMASIEVMSAPLRNALKPARIGITKIQDAVRVVDRWIKEA
ncbi:toll/interleukin-1 receptor domain-containing protein [Streptomyces sp. SP18CS02]|uniref:toll/interleukin-1 receptor domain-containing protein n=1 Tax=Streptomyces sp. SP18CS02 TaxID=3002531 RepID=UPI002E78863D|nr:toll/interleukin-1 receptor domain-containing protein [Streptomyces sp. SP18CS02]MEE1755632.1 toll/interleukin-1 receptor domain-containing protein [Streptomyces sp. SP18CS02]